MHRNTHKRKNKQTRFNACNTGVYPIRTHGFGVYKGARKVWSVRVDETLLKQAKPVLKAKFGSECRGVETWLAGLVATTKGEQLDGVYPSNTVEIGELNIIRALRPRRKVEVDNGDSGLEERCRFCAKPAVDKFQYSPSEKVYDLCSFHAELMLSSGNWRENPS